MLLMVGMNHRTVPLRVREKLRVNETSLNSFIGVLRVCEGRAEGVILSTCNRVEVYVWAKQTEAAISSIKDFLADNYVGDEKLDPFLCTLADEEVISHLFRVSAGLDSQVIGEDQILGQVKKAYRLSHEVNASDGFLKPLFHRAVSIGKKVREKTEISRGKVSVGSVGVELARKKVASLRDRTILVLGAGKISELVGANLSNEGVKAIIVSNRSYKKACHLAQSLKGEAVRFNRLEEGLRHADIVISSTAASHYIIKKSMLKRVMDGRDKPLLIIDLALPRDIEPTAADLEGLTLYNMEDLDLVIKGNMLKRRNEAKKAEEIVKKEAEEFGEKMKKTGWNQSYAGV